LTLVAGNRCGVRRYRRPSFVHPLLDGEFKHMAMTQHCATHGLEPICGDVWWHVQSVRAQERNGATIAAFMPAKLASMIEIGFASGIRAPI
jgi:hypothetical protein